MSAGPDGVAAEARPRLTRKAKLKFDAIEQKYLLLSPERGIALSDSAAEILKRCDGAKTVRAIVHELADEHGAPVAEVARDVALFLDEMRKRGLVELAELT